MGNARKINDEINVFEGFADSQMGHYILAIIIAGQVAMVQQGGDWCQTVPLNAHQFLVCVAVGFMSLPVGLVLRLLPTPNFDALFAVVGLGGGEEEEQGGAKVDSGNGDKEKSE